MRKINKSPKKNTKFSKPTKFGNLIEEISNNSGTFDISTHLLSSEEIGKPRIQPLQTDRPFLDGNLVFTVEMSQYGFSSDNKTIIPEIQETQSSSSYFSFDGSTTPFETVFQFTPGDTEDNVPFSVPFEQDYQFIKSPENGFVETKLPTHLAAHLVKTAEKLFLNDPSLTVLSLIWKIGDEGAKFLSSALGVNRTLTELHMKYNEIGDEGAKCLSSALEVNKTLTTLNLRGNQIGHEGAKYLSTALEVNKTLTSLDLGVNQIGDEGAKCLSKALEVNKTLTELDLYFNRIGVEGAKYVSSAVEINTRL